MINTGLILSLQNPKSLAAGKERNVIFPQVTDEMTANAIAAFQEHLTPSGNSFKFEENPEDIFATNKKVTYSGYLIGFVGAVVLGENFTNPTTKVEDPCVKFYLADMSQNKFQIGKNGNCNYGNYYIENNRKNKQLFEKIEKLLSDKQKVEAGMIVKITTDSRWIFNTPERNQAYMPIKDFEVLHVLGETVSLVETNESKEESTVV